MDTRLAKACTENDAESFAERAQAHYRPLYAVAYSIVGDWSAAEDIVQETLLVAWVNLSTLRNPRVFGVWLRQITRNLCKNWLRARTYRQKLEMRRRDLFPGPGERQDDARQRVSAGETHSELWAALRSLNPNLREAVFLYYLQDNSVAEVARALECTEAAVKKRLERARTQLRTYFEARLQAELTRERERAGSAEVARRFLLGAALGPVDPVVGRAAAGQGLGLWTHAFRHGELRTLAKGVIPAGGKSTAVTFAAGMMGALAVGLGSFLIMSRSPAPPETRVIEQTPLAFRSLEPMPPYTAGPAPELSVEPEPAPGSVSKGPSLTTSEEGPGGYTVTGKVTDPHGHAIPSARVRVLPGWRPESAVRFGGGGGAYYESGAPAGEPPRSAPPISARGEVLGPSPDRMMAKPADADRFTAITSSSGEFRIQNIPTPGPALVTASAEGFIATAEPFTIPPGEQPADKDLILRPGIVFRGRLSDTAGRPLTDAAVCIVEQTDGAGGMSVMSGSWLDAAQTNARGEFTLTAEAPGRASLRVYSESLGGLSFPDVLVEEGGYVELTFAYARVEGRITMPNGEPAARHTVILDGRIRQENLDELGGLTSFGERSGDTYRAPTDDQGRFVIPAVDPGQVYTAKILGQDGLTVAEVKLPAGLQSGAEFIWDHALNDPILVRGVVRAASSGKPLPGVEVICQDVDDHDITARATTGQDGSYELRVLSGPGTYEFFPCYKPVGLMNGIETGDEPPAIYELPASGDCIVDLALPAPWVRTFRILTERGEPLRNVQVKLTERTGDSTRGRGFPALCDTDGRVRLDGLTPGVEVQCEFSHDGYRSASSKAVTGGAGEEFPEETIVLERDPDAS